jgi:stromal membrane-associated protein
MKVPDTLTANDIGAGWGAAPTTNSKSTPTVVADEDFGGWTSAAPTSGQGTGKRGGGGFGGNDDLFSNVWE